MYNKVGLLPIFEKQKTTLMLNFFSLFSYWDHLIYSLKQAKISPFIALVDIILDNDHGYYFLSNTEIISIGLSPQKIKLQEKNGVLIGEEPDSMD